NLVLMEPSCEDEVGMLLDWCLNETMESSYLRLISIPWDVSFSLPQGYRPKVGQGVTLVEGREAVIMTYGPVLLSAAVEAAKILEKTKGIRIKVVNLPWLNRIDAEWLREV